MINFFLTYVVPGSVFFPILLFLLNRRTVTSAMKVLFVYLVVAGAVNITAVILAELNQRNLWLLHPYTVIEMVLLLFFFIKLVQARTAKIVIWFLLIAFTLACVFNWLFVQNTYYFNTYTRSIEAVIIIGVSAWYWLGGSSKTTAVAWADNPVNWIISGLLLYFSSNLFLFLFSNFLLAHPNRVVRDIVWVTHGFLLILMYVLFGIAFIKSKNDR